MNTKEINIYREYFLEKFFELAAQPGDTLAYARERAAQAAETYCLLRSKGMEPARSLERCLCMLETAI